MPYCKFWVWCGSWKLFVVHSKLWRLSISQCHLSQMTWATFLWVQHLRHKLGLVCLILNSTSIINFYNQNPNKRHVGWKSSSGFTEVPRLIAKEYFWFDSSSFVLWYDCLSKSTAVIEHICSHHQPGVNQGQLAGSCAEDEAFFLFPSNYWGPIITLQYSVDHK